MKASITGLRINTDGTTIKDRKPSLLLCSNHHPYRRLVRRVFYGGTAISDGRGGYKKKPEK